MTSDDLWAWWSARARSARARTAALVSFDRREVAAIALLAVLVVSGAGLAYVRAKPAEAAALAPVGSPSSSPGAPPAVGELVVHVVGAVRSPGVYRFADGARVIDAIEAAGGFARGAARAAINLARLLTDGEQLAVPTKDQAAVAASPGGGGGSGAGTAGSLLDLNAADAAALDALPGIGPVLAERIVAYREQHGPFRSVNDLQKVSGIGPKKFDSLEPLVTV